MTTESAARIFLFYVFEPLVWAKKFKSCNNLVVHNKANKGSFIAQRTLVAHCQGVGTAGRREKFHSSGFMVEASGWLIATYYARHFLLCWNGDCYFPVVTHHHQLAERRLYHFSCQLCIKTNDGDDTAQ